MATRNTCIKVMNWNARGISNKYLELQHELDWERVDVAVITETHLEPRLKLKINGYHIHRKDRNVYGGGVAVLLKHGMKYELRPLNNIRPEIDLVCIKILTDRDPIFIVSLYIPPKIPITDLDLNYLLTTGNKTMIIGDLNCKNIAWNCAKNNRNGNILNRFINRNPNVKIIATDEPTYYPSNGRGEPSVLDIAITKTNLNTSQPITKTILSSDHIPVFLKIGNIPQHQNKIFKYHYSKANWDMYRSEIEHHISNNRPLHSTDDIDSSLDVLTSAIKIAADNSIPRIEIATKHIELPCKTKALIKLKNYFRKKYQKTRTDIYRKIYNRLTHAVKQELLIYRNETWNKFLSTLDPQQGNLWKVAKYFTKKSAPIPPLQQSGTYRYSGLEKANILADQFEKVHNQNLHLGKSYFTKHVHREVKKFLKNNIVSPEDVEVATPHEIWTIVRSLRNKKAPGHDNINGQLLKQLPRNAIILLCRIINATMTLSYFPSTWKNANIITIKKPNKPPDLPSSYRPISLLTTLSKVAEKTYLKRINEHARNNNILIDEQFGFRAAHSTTAQLARLADIITHNFNIKKYTGMVTIDIEKAFDTVWHAGLIYKLTEMKFPSYLIHLLHTYLENRQFRVILGDSKSTSRTIPAGVPQGSVLGPVLFCLFINDIPKHKNVTYSLFADDTALFTCSWRTETIIKRLQDSLNMLMKYLTKWKIKINGTKTEAIIFTKRRPVINKHIAVQGVNIEWAQSLKYLGLQLDNKLNYTEHCSNISRVTTGKMCTLFPLLNRRSQLSLQNKILLYKTVLRPSLVYASPVWSNTSKSNYQKIQVVQNKCLRIIGNYPRFKRIIDLHDELQVELVNDYIYRTTVNFFSKCRCNTNKLIQEIGNYEKDNLPFRRYKHKLTKHILL